MRPTETEYQHHLRGVRALHSHDQRWSLQGAMCCARVPFPRISLLDVFSCNFYEMSCGDDGREKPWSLKDWNLRDWIREW